VYKKTCPKCHQPSFSSSDTDRWIYPVCSFDITRVTSQDSDRRKQTKPHLFIIKNSYLEENPNLNAKIKPFVFQSFE
jgi:uncharacterized Zn finger protein (UPF0148 family)